MDKVAFLEKMELQLSLTVSEGDEGFPFILIQLLGRWAFEPDLGHFKWWEYYPSCQVQRVDIRVEDHPVAL